MTQIEHINKVKSKNELSFHSRLLLRIQESFKKNLSFQRKLESNFRVINYTVLILKNRIESVVKTFIFFAVSIIFLFNGCGLFNTRGVEPPIVPRTNFYPPTTPDLVIVNLKFAVLERDVNNYIACLVDSNYSDKRYWYVADFNSQTQYTVFKNWSLNYERMYYNNLISLTNSNAVSDLYLTNENWLTSVDSSVYDADYLLRFDHQKLNVSNILKGKLRFIISKDSRNLWSINKWIDYQSLPSDTTWSVLKANFVN